MLQWASAQMATGHTDKIVLLPEQEAVGCRRRPTSADVSAAIVEVQFIARLIASQNGVDYLLG